MLGEAKLVNTNKQKRQQFLLFLTSHCSPVVHFSFQLETLKCFLYGIIYRNGKGLAPTLCSALTPTPVLKERMVHPSSRMERKKSFVLGINPLKAAES